MSNCERKGLRPSVIDPSTFHALEEYLGFRHVVRSAYPSQLRPERVAELAKNLGPLFQRLHQQLSRLIEHLEQLALVEQEDAGTGTETGQSDAGDDASGAPGAHRESR